MSSSPSDEILKNFDDALSGLRGYLSTIVNTKENIDYAELASMLIMLRNTQREVISKNENLLQSRQAIKTKTDAMNLRLQNLKYEAFHLRKAISKCKEFSSQHEKLDLVPMETFLKTAPEDLQNAENEHQLMLNRLQFETKERQRLQALVETMKKQRASVTEQNATKTKFLAGLRNNVTGILQASQPLHKYFSMDDFNNRTLVENAKLLPTPLYVLYNNFAAYSANFDASVSVMIQGSIEQAKEEMSEKQDEDMDSSPTTEDERPAKRQRLAPAETSEAAASSSSGSSNDTAASTTPFKQFPLRIKATIPVQINNDTSKIMEITFSYLTEYNLVVASSNADVNDAQLWNIFPNDDGTKSPNLHMLQNCDFTTLSSGRPYKWAQILCGLEFMEPRITSGSGESPKLDDFKRTDVETLCEAVKYKTKAKRLLDTQLKQLEEEKQIPNVGQAQMALGQKIVITSVIRKSSPEDNSEDIIILMKRDDVVVEATVTILIGSYPQTLPRVKLAYKVPSNAQSTSITDLAIPQHLLSYVKDQQAIKERTLDPTSSGDPVLADIEYEANYYEPMELISKIEKKELPEYAIFYLVSYQLNCLVRCLNIHLEIEKTNSNLTTIESNNKQSVQTRFCLKTTKGRDLKKPFLQKEGMFYQRL